MDFVIELVGEIFFEIFAEGFVALSSAFVKGFRVSERAKKVIGGIFAVLAAILVLCLIIGVCILLEDGRSILGWILVALNIAYVILGISLKLFVKNNR